MLRVREIHRNAIQTISVVESVETWQGRIGNCFHAGGKIEPLAMIVRSPDSEYAVGINAEPVDAGYLFRLLELEHVGEVPRR